MHCVCDVDTSSVIMYVDNQSAIALAKNPVQHQRSKHIDIKYHFVRMEVQNGLVTLIYVPSEKKCCRYVYKTCDQHVFEKTLF